jgi:molecular chaperone DnaK
MVADAASHAEEDKKFRELVDARNQADALIHASEKSLRELGDKVTGEQRHAVESAISDLKSVLDKGEKDAIERKAAALAEASAAIAQKLYAEEGQAGAGGEDGARDSSGESSEDVVDAEFEEVDDDRKSKSG